MSAPSAPRNVRSLLRAKVLRLWLLPLVMLLSAGAPVAAPAVRASHLASSSLPDTTNGIHRAVMFLRCYSQFGSWVGSSSTCTQTAQTSLSTVNGKIDTGFLYDDAPLAKFADPALAGALGIALEVDRFPAYPYNYQDFTSSLYTSGNYAQGENWILANHPDWLEYQCDRTTPAWEYSAVPADGNAAAFLPFDTANPNARAYYFNTYVKPAIDNGAPLVFIDNVTVFNAWGRCGHYDTNHNWVQEWSGAYQDTAYQQNVYNWQQYLYSAIKAENPNVIVAYNYDPAASGDPSSIYTQFFQGMDLLVNESGFNYWGDHRLTDAQWQAEAQVIAATQAAGVGTFHQESIETSTVSGITFADKNWGIGNYLLFKGAHDYIGFSPYFQGLPDYGSYVDLPEYSAAIGTPNGAMYQNQGVYRRDYSNGLVLVNPSSASGYTVNLPSTFYDMDGNNVGSSVYLAPATADVLLGTNSGSGGSSGSGATGNGSGKLTVTPGSGTYNVGDTITAYLVITASAPFNAASGTVTVSSNLSVQSISAPTAYYGPCAFQNVSQAPSTANPSFAESYSPGYAASSCTLYVLTLKATGGGTGTVSASNGVIVNASDGTNEYGSAQNASYTINGSSGSSNQAPAFTSASSATFTVGTAGSFTVAASGTPAATLSEANTDTLPSGVSFNATSGVLSGTPASGTAGTYTLHFTASNGVSPNATQTFTLTVNNAAAPPPASSNPTGTLLMYPSNGSYHVGDTFSVTLYAFGNGPTFTAAGATVGVTSNLSIVGLYAGNCNFSYSTTPSASNPSFAGTIAGGTTNCVVYYLSVRATGAGTGYVYLSNAYMTASDGSNILKATTDGAFTIS